jgi:hypothetical protein
MPYDKPYNYVNVTESVDTTDVMEAVAHDTDGPEPEAADASAWLLEHTDRLGEVMTYAAREYIQKNWGKDRNGK